MGVPNRTRYFVRVSSKAVGKIEFLDSHERASYSRAIIILYSRIELGQPAVYQPDCNRVSSPAVCTDGIGFTKHAGQMGGFRANTLVSVFPSILSRIYRFDEKFKSRISEPRRRSKVTGKRNQTSYASNEASSITENSIQRITRNLVSLCGVDLNGNAIARRWRLPVITAARDSRTSRKDEQNSELCCSREPPTFHVDETSFAS